MIECDFYREITDKALKLGAYQAAIITSKEIVVDERVRLKCQVPVCRDFNKHLFCPPNTISVTKFKELVSNYSVALIVQVQSEGYEEKQLIAAEIKLHELINQLESAALVKGRYLATGFIGSSCKLCSECVGCHSKLPCRHPFKARPSIEAMGVDIFKTAKQAEISFNLGKSANVVYNGLILLD